jgi:hypothetical protein
MPEEEYRRITEVTYLGQAGPRHRVPLITAVAGIAASALWRRRHAQRRHAH